MCCQSTPPLPHASMKRRLLCRIREPLANRRWQRVPLFLPLRVPFVRGALQVRCGSFKPELSLLVTAIHLHHVALQCRLALRAAVDHVAARVLFYLDALRVAHHRLLVDDQYRGHEGA